MCEKCVNHVKELFPSVPEDQVGILLTEATSFPFGSDAYVREQLEELRDNTDGTIEGAIAYTNNQLDEQMKKFVDSRNET